MKGLNDKFTSIKNIHKLQELVN